MIPTMSLRLEDQLFVSPNAVVDQSLLAIRPAISFSVKGAIDGCFARSSNNILTTAYGTGGKQAKRGVNIQQYWNHGRATYEPVRDPTGRVNRAIKGLRQAELPARGRGILFAALHEVLSIVCQFAKRANDLCRAVRLRYEDATLWQIIFRHSHAARCRNNLDRRPSIFDEFGKL